MDSSFVEVDNKSSVYTVHEAQGKRPGGSLKRLWVDARSSLNLTD